MNWLIKIIVLLIALNYLDMYLMCDTDIPIDFGEFSFPYNNESIYQIYNQFYNQTTTANTCQYGTITLYGKLDFCGCNVSINTNVTLFTNDGDTAFSETMQLSVQIGENDTCISAEKTSTMTN